MLTATLNAARRALLLVFAWAGAGAAQSRGTLLLGDLYRDLQRENPKLAAARALARATDARVPATSLAPDPQVQLGFMNYEVPGLRPMDPLGMTQLQVMQMIPFPGKRALAGAVGRSQADAQHERVSDLGWELRNQAAIFFYELYEAEQRLVLARETLRLLQDLQRTAEAMYRVGEGRQADVLRAHVEVARMTEDTLRMSAMRRALQVRLNALRNRSPDVDVGAALLPTFPEALPTLDALSTTATRERPMLRAGEHAVSAADAGMRLARRELWPDLTLGVQLGQRSGAMGRERMASLMFGATLPFFASQRQLRMREEAQAMRTMARAELDAMRTETIGRLAELQANLTSTRNLLALYRLTVLPQAEAAVTSSLAAYRAGSVDFMTTLDNRMKENEYRQQVIGLQAEEGKVWAELEMLVGRELFDPTITRHTNDDGANR
jgi:outer membrane protein TolC